MSPTEGGREEAQLMKSIVGGGGGKGVHVGVQVGGRGGEGGSGEVQRGGQSGKSAQPWELGHCGGLPDQTRVVVRTAADGNRGGVYWS